MLPQSYTRGDLIVSTDVARLDLDAIHDFLSRESYWASGIPRAVLERAVAGSLCFGAYDRGAQVGFARVVTDAATFAYLCDVFVLEPHRGRGIGTWLLECVLAHPSLQGLRQIALATRDAHALYRRFGFTTVAVPPSYMHIVRPHAPEGSPATAPDGR